MDKIAVVDQKIASWVIVAVACLAIVVGSVVGYLLWRNTQAITDGNRALICIVSLPEQERQSMVARCLEDNGL